MFVAAADTIHGPCGAGGGGSLSLSGWPDSMRLMSGSGPFGPISHGVWQSLQPATVTRYLPRASFSALVSMRLESVAAEVCARAGVATAKVTPTEIASTAYSNGMRFMQSLLVVGKMLVDPALDERDAFGIDLLHAQRRHACERVVRLHAQRQHVRAAIARDALRAVGALRTEAARVAEQ